MTWGLLSITGELGAGISDLCIASFEASSTRRVRRVKTLLTRKAMIRQLITRKITTPRLMVTVGSNGKKERHEEVGAMPEEARKGREGMRE